MAISEGKAKDLLPALVTANNTVEQRFSRRGDAIIMPLGKGRCSLAKEGSYYVATNPTPGTGIAGIAATGAFADTESLLLVQNDNAAGSGVDIVLDYLKLQVTAAGTSGTDVRYVSKLDDNSRYTSGGSAIVEVNPNMNVAAASGANIRFGALVTTAATSSARLVGNGLIRNVIAVVGDQYLFDFGGDPAAGAGHAVAGTAIANLVINHAPVVIGPSQAFVMSLHATAQSAASSFEFELGYWER